MSKKGIQESRSSFEGKNFRHEKIFLQFYSVISIPKYLKLNERYYMLILPQRSKNWPRLIKMNVER